MSAGADYLPGAGEGTVPQLFGAYYGYVAQNAGTASTYRVRLRVPQVLGDAMTGWAPPMVPLSSVPAVGTRVIVMFVGGDVTQPVYGGNV